MFMIELLMIILILLISLSQLWEGERIKENIRSMDSRM